MPDWGAIPWVGVIVAVVAAQVIGFLWYGPLFGKPWRAAMGVTDEMAQDRSGLGAAVGVGVFCSLVSAIALAIILTMSRTPDIESGCKVGFLAAACVGSYILLAKMYEKRDSTLTAINIANQVVTLVVMGAIIGKMW
jgi:Protein of unknown function (DUF1761)